jgi:hypothetical protein
MGYALAGMIVGVVIAATIGLDFWPSEQRPATISNPALEVRRLDGRYAELEQELGEITQKHDKVVASLAELRSTGVFPDAPDPGASGDPVDSDSLLDSLRRRDWRRFSTAVESLLVSGEPGFSVLIDVATRALHDAELRQGSDGVLAALSRVAFRRGGETAELIGALLVAPAMETDAVFAQRVLKWSAWYFAVTPEVPGNDEQSRAMLVQSLQRRLLQGDAWISDVLASLEALDVAASAESLETLLEDDARARDHATLLKYLGRRSDPEAVEVLVRFIDDGDPRQLKTLLAIKELAAKRDEPAEIALKKLLASDDAETRYAAHSAYFSVRAALSPGLSVLVDYLNSDVESASKERLLAHVRNVNSSLYRALGREPGLLRDEGLQAELRVGLATLPAGY